MDLSSARGCLRRVKWEMMSFTFRDIKKRQREPRATQIEAPHATAALVDQYRPAGTILESFGASRSKRSAQVVIKITQLFTLIGLNNRLFFFVCFFSSSPPGGAACRAARSPSPLHGKYSRGIDRSGTRSVPGEMLTPHLWLRCSETPRRCFHTRDRTGEDAAT